MSTHEWVRLFCVGAKPERFRSLASQTVTPSSSLLSNASDDYSRPLSTRNVHTVVFQTPMPDAKYAAIASSTVGPTILQTNTAAAIDAPFIGR